MPFTLATVSVILFYVWVADPLWDVRGIWRHVPAALVVALTMAHAARRREWGFEARAFWPALAWATAATLPVVAALWMAGGALGTRQPEGGLVLTFLYVILWGGAQQFVLQTVILREAQRATSRRAGIVLAAAIFGAIHLPNPFLAPLTFLGGLVWCGIYDRHPNLVPLALSHAATTVAVLASFDDAITGHLRIGYHYLAAQ